jgi:hypothetical protein
LPIVDVNTTMVVDGREKTVVVDRREQSARKVGGDLFPMAVTSNNNSAATSNNNSAARSFETETMAAGRAMGDLVVQTAIQRAIVDEYTMAIVDEYAMGVIAGREMARMAVTSSNVVDVETARKVGEDLVLLLMAARKVGVVLFLFLLPRAVTSHNNSAARS